MKVRLGFVSNSSSSSFIVFDKQSYNENAMEDFASFFEEYVDGNVFSYVPETCFGWDFTTYSGVREAFDWSYMMLKAYPSKKNYKVMLEFINEVFPSVEKLYYIDDEDEVILIDHQSICRENAAMLESVEDLKSFILGNGMIYGGNDNSSMTWKMDESTGNFTLEEID